MAESDHCDDIHADVINARLGQDLAFLREVLDNPLLVKIIPPGSVVRHREVGLDHDRVSVRLTAYKSPAEDTWSATIAGFGGRTARAMWTADHDRRSVTHGLQPTHQHLFVSNRETAKAALDALEADLRRAFEVDRGAAVLSTHLRP
jgi:hypothetical protein